LRRIRSSAKRGDVNGLRRFFGTLVQPREGALPRREEARLLAEARAGDPRALRRILTALSAPAYRFGLGFCRDPHDAEDVMQEVLAALARGLARFRGESSLSSWAFVVARRVCMRRRRRRSGEPESLVPLEAPATGGRGPLDVADRATDPHERLERRELAALLERAIGSLPASQRQVLLLRDVEGLTARETGKVLGLRERAVKSRLHRARAALRAGLAPHVATPGDAGLQPSVSREGCPDTAGLVSRYLEGELSPARCAELATHVDGCPDCGEACASLRAALGACRSWGQQALPADLRARVRLAIRRVVEAREARIRPGARRVAATVAADRARD